ncbi:hypothetical protein B0H13DRAFT_1935852 [Mycena leptocephala]|nr:hypothetical protein B0H13DRAFT_1935852 [Mycena leptocephala]
MTALPRRVFNPMYPPARAGARSSSRPKPVPKSILKKKYSRKVTPYAPDVEVVVVPNSSDKQEEEDDEDDEMNDEEDELDTPSFPSVPVTPKKPKVVASAPSSLSSSAVAIPRSFRQRLSSSHLVAVPGPPPELTVGQLEDDKAALERSMDKLAVRLQILEDPSWQPLPVDPVLPFVLPTAAPPIDYSGEPAVPAQTPPVRLCGREPPQRSFKSTGNGTPPLVAVKITTCQFLFRTGAFIQDRGYKKHLWTHKHIIQHSSIAHSGVGSVGGVGGGICIWGVWCCGWLLGLGRDGGLVQDIGGCSRMIGSWLLRVLGLIRVGGVLFGVGAQAGAGPQQDRGCSGTVGSGSWAHIPILPLADQARAHRMGGIATSNYGCQLIYLRSRIIFWEDPADVMRNLWGDPAQPHCLHVAVSGGF